MYFILEFKLILWKWIDILPKVIIIKTNNPFKYIDILQSDNSYIPLENSNIPNIKELIVLLNGNTCFNRVTNNDINNNFSSNNINRINFSDNILICPYCYTKNLFEKINELNKDISEKKKLITEGRMLIKNLLSSKEKINNFRQWNNIDNLSEEKQNLNLSEYHLYHAYIKMQKLIYQNLNKCVEFGEVCIGEVWIPEIYYPKLEQEIISSSDKS